MGGSCYFLGMGMKIDKSLAFDPSVARREQAVKDGVNGLKKEQWLSFGFLPGLLGFDSKSPTAMLAARQKLGAAFEEFLTDNKAGPERRDVVLGQGGGPAVVRECEQAGL